MSQLILRSSLIFSAFLCLTFSSLYAHSVLIEIDGQGRFSFLIASIVFSLPLILLDFYKHRISFRNVHLYLLIFYFYFVIRYGAYSLSTTELFSYIIGTTSGTALALVLGFSVFSAVSYILLLIPNRKSNIIILLGTLAFLVINIFILKNSLDVNLEDLRQDVFLINNQDGYYQRAANYLLIVVTSSLFLVVLVLKAVFRSTITRVTLCLPLGLLAFLAALYSQLIGSNSGLLATGLISLFSIAFAVSPRPDSSVTLRLPTESRSSLLNSYKYEAVILLLLVAVIASIVAYALSARILDFAAFRFSGFGSGENSSLSSRIDILFQNFDQHIFYNFIFGDPHVDIKTTGKGTYLHSMLSVWSHLGIIGLLLLFLFFRSLILAFMRSYQLSSSSGSSDILRLTFILLTIVLGMSFCFSFFTWFPLWFTIGFSVSCCSRSLSRIDLRADLHRRP